MSISSEVGMGAVRFSLGRMTTRNEIDVVVERLTDLFAKTGSRRDKGQSGDSEKD
jgi:cysteine sulfinate desulfinase/cysteine desulfurase-like protein